MAGCEKRTNGRVTIRANDRASNWASNRARPIGVVLAAALAFAVPAAQAGTLTPQQQRDVDRWLGELRTAPDSDTAQVLEQRIHTAWRSAGSPAARMLLERGLSEAQKNDGADATDDLDASLTLDPDYTEAFTARAAARLLSGDYRGAIADAGTALQREPRNFAAFEILSQIAEARGDWKSALAAWQKALELSPRTHDAEQRLEMLRTKVEGEAT